MNFNFAVKINIQSRDIETKFYMVIMVVISSLLAVWIYSFASNVLSEDQINSTASFSGLRPRFTEELRSPQ